MAAKTAEPQDPTPMEGTAAPAYAPATPSPAVQTEATVAQQSMLNVMRDKFAAEKRVKVKIKNDGPVPVQVNGYSFLIRENVWVEVPESVAAILDEAGYI